MPCVMIVEFERDDGAPARRAPRPLPARVDQPVLDPLQHAAISHFGHARDCQRGAASASIRADDLKEAAMTTPLYEVFALRYAHFADRTQGDNLINPDDHAAPMPLDFFVWAIRGGGRTIVVDTGFDAASAARRNRTWLRSPIEALARPRHRRGEREGRGAHAIFTGTTPALGGISGGALPPAGRGDGLLHRPLHVPRAAPQDLRHRAGDDGGAARLRRARRLP